MTVLGLEHEYEVRRYDVPVDFQLVMPSVRLGGRHLDPVDAFALRTRDGWVLTCDGAEAETVAPPIELRPGFAHDVAAWAAEMANALTSALPTGSSLHGVSTHISVEVPDHLTMSVCGLFARRFAPALMLLADGPEAFGLLVRPRHRRVELGLGFTAGCWLRAATALAVGGVLACVDVAAKRLPRQTLPSRVDGRFEGARARFGWYIDRRAYGPDLYALGRSARLRSGITRRRTAVILERAWAVARERLDAAELAATTDLEDADGLVSARLSLHCECAQARVPTIARERPEASPLGGIRHQRRRWFDVVPVAATWDFTVFAVEGPARTLYLSVPREAHGQFLPDLDRGVLDAPIIAELHRAPARRTLSSYAQAARGGRFDIVRLDVLRPPERAYDGSFL